MKKKETLLGSAIVMCAILISGYIFWFIKSTFDAYQSESVHAMTTVAQKETSAYEKETVTIAEEKTVNETTTAYEEENVLPEGYCYSYLTGEAVPVAIGNTRPVAVMLSNVKDAVPQAGINSAGVIYEAPAEGGINRLMAIFEDMSGITRIGSVRSARTYFVYFAYEFRAFYCHFGQASLAQLHLDCANCQNINGLDNTGYFAYYRIPERPSPHNAYTTPEMIQNAIDVNLYNRSFSMYDNYDEYYGHYLFSYDSPVELTDGMNASYVVPGYPTNEPWFEYNSEDGLYYRYQYKAPHADEDGMQIAVKNIILQVTYYEHYGDTPYLNFFVDKGGSGFYITNGKAIPVTWSKESEWGITHYFDQNGEEIQLNTGKTWVCIIQHDMGASISIE